MSKLLGIIANTITFFDSSPSPVSLLIKGESEVSSIFGGIVSLVSIIWSIYLTWATIINYIYNSNPTVITNIQYDVQEEFLKAEDFFVSLSFFSMKKEGIYLADRYNDLDNVLFLNNITYDCQECNNSLLEKDLQTKKRGYLNLCSESYFNNFTISGYSKGKSKGIVDIFKKYSYCMPDGMNTVIKNSDDNTDMKYSFIIKIPKHDTKVDIKDIPRNIADKKSLKDAFKIIKEPVPLPEPEKKQEDKRKDSQSDSARKIKDNPPYPQKSGPSRRVPKIPRKTPSAPTNNNLQKPPRTINLENHLIKSNNLRTLQGNKN